MERDDYFDSGEVSSMDDSLIDDYSGILTVDLSKGSKSTSSFSFSNFHMPHPDEMVEWNSPSFMFPLSMRPEAAGKMGSITRAMEDPNLGCDAMDLISFRPLLKIPDPSQNPMALANQLLVNNGSIMEQVVNFIPAPASTAVDSVSEIVRCQQELANEQFIRTGRHNEIYQQQSINEMVNALSVAQRMNLQMPLNIAASYAPIEPLGLSNINLTLATTGMDRHVNAPTSMTPSFSFGATSPEPFVCRDEESSKMEATSFHTSQLLQPEASPDVTRTNKSGTIFTNTVSHPGSSEIGETRENLDRKPAAKKGNRQGVYPRSNDVCFAAIKHPGTIAWREKVDKLAGHVDLEWSVRVHQAVRSQMEAEGRRFLIGVKSNDVQNKGVKDRVWRTATDEEIELKTKQRFRDWRKTPKTEVKKPRGRPRTKARSVCEMQTTPSTGGITTQKTPVRKAILDAIHQCQQIINQETTSEDQIIIEKTRQAQEKLDLLLPMSLLPWSHVLESELEQRKSARLGTKQNAAMILEMESETFRQHERINKLKKAENHVVNFVQCLMENGINELNEVLDTGHSGHGRGDRGADEEEEDEDGDEQDYYDHPQNDNMNTRNRQGALTVESHHRKRDREADVSETAGPDYYQYDLLTVFQATPLAFTLKSGETRPLPPLDIDFEKKSISDALRDARNVGARVDVEFDVATIERLGEVLAKGESHIIHLSCHGHPDYLAFDNGWGGMQMIRVHELEPLIRFGAGNLELVFLSSCCSRPAGEALVAAGVPHVICCHHDQKPRDRVAIEFARNFYRAVACGKTLKAAFNLARQSIHVSSQGSPSEAEKFVLLPEKSEGDDYHAVNIFTQRNRMYRGLNITYATVMRPFPCLPGNFKMNSLDVYHILDLLCRVDVVKIVGNTGARRLAAAVASYVRARPHTMSIDDIFWFPPVVESDYASKLFRRVCDILEGTSHLAGDKLMGEGSKYVCHFNEAMSYFVGKRCLFVINSKRFRSDVQSSRLERFVCDILNDLHVKVILVCGRDAQERYARLPRQNDLIGTYAPQRFDPDTFCDEAKASRDRPHISKDGVVGDDESLTDSSEASVPVEIHFDTDTRLDIPLLTPSSQLQSGTARKTYPPPSSRQKADVKRNERTQRLVPLLENFPLESNNRIDTLQRNSRKMTAPLGLMTTMDEDHCTFATSSQPSFVPVITLDAFDAIDGKPSSVGAKDGLIHPETSPSLKGRPTHVLRLDASGMARLYGRDNEISLLMDAYSRVSIPSAPSEIVAVHGPSGSGKSTLVKHMEEAVALDRSGIFAAGKFDQIYAATKPYSAIVDAISRLCRKIADGPELKKVKLNIKEALGSEVDVISELIPAISLLTGEPTTEKGDVSKEMEFAFTRFKDLFRSFIRAVSSPNHPIVVFLDDLQWADQASCALIESIVSDTDSKNVLFIWAYRDGESGEVPSPVINVVNSSVRLSNVYVGAVDSNSLNEMIADLTQQSQDVVRPLSDLLSHETGGNIHFVIQLMQMIQEDGLMAFSEELRKWEWDIGLIQTRTAAIGNVAHLLSAKIARQHGDVQSVLQLASCLGFFFDIQLLESVASSEGLLSESRPSEALLPYSDPEEIGPGDLLTSSGHGHAKFLELLQIARKENLVDQTQDPYRFKFAHDLVRHCVYDMIRSPEIREEMHMRIGMLIWKQSKTKSNDESSVFLATDQLNRGSRHIKDEERSRLAQLNLESAAKAVQKSAYTLAAEFLERGINLLNHRTMWQKQTYDLFLELHTKSAEMESILGNFDASDNRVTTVLLRARTLEEKLRAYHVQMDSLAVRRRMGDAITLGLQVLRQLGETISQHPSFFSIVIELIKTKRVLKGRRGHDLLTLHEMSDARKVATMRLLNSIAFVSWHSDRNDLLTFVFLRMTRITLIHGLCKFSPFAFAAFGMLLGVLGNIQQAYDFGTLALQLLEKAKTKDCNCITQLIVLGFLEHFKKPLSLITQNMSEASRVGMENGQVLFACNCLSGLVGLIVVTGMPLRSVIVDAQCKRRIFQEYNQEFADVLSSPWHQFALNMTGQADNVMVLTGAAMDEEKFLNDSATMAKANFHYIRMVLLYILGNFEGASVELDTLERRSGNTEGTHYMAYFNFLFSGLVCLAMAQKTSRRKYTLGFRKYINKISKFAKGGGLNCSPMLMLLQAVQKTTEHVKRIADVRSSFENAIVACARSGYIYMEAIANERAGEYMLSLGDEHEARSYLHRARQLYSEWDAESKVQLLEKEYAILRSLKDLTALPSPDVLNVEEKLHAII